MGGVDTVDVDGEEVTLETSGLLSFFRPLGDLVGGFGGGAETAVGLSTGIWVVAGSSVAVH